MANAFKTGSQMPNPAPGKDFAMRSSVSHKKIEKWKENLILFSMWEKTRTDACWISHERKDNPPQANDFSVVVRTILEKFGLEN